MSRNAIAAMAVIFVSGFAGCAATARADAAAAPASYEGVVDREPEVAPKRAETIDAFRITAPQTFRAIRTP